jgi:hypothetical protein
MLARTDGVSGVTLGKALRLAGARRRGDLSGGVESGLKRSSFPNRGLA